MNFERYLQFTTMISGIYKDIQKLKSDKVEQFGLKNVHVLWIYLLLKNPDGLSAEEMSQKSSVTRALVSREIKELEDEDVIKCRDEVPNKRRYGWKFVLTETGLKIAEEINAIILRVQSHVDCGISEKDLMNFYSTLEKLFENFEDLTQDTRILDVN